MSGGRRRWVAAIAALAALGLGAGPAPARAADVTGDAVAERYEAGKAALEAGRFEDALVAFEAAEALVVDEVTRWQILLGLALTHELAGRPLEAIARYRAFLGRSNGSPRAAEPKWRARRAEARTSIATLEGEVLQTLGALAVEAGPEVAEVVVSSRAGAARVAPPAVLYLPPGPWSVTASVPGRAPFSREGALRVGERVNVVVALPLLAQPGPPQGAGSDRAEERSAPIAPWVAVGAGAAVIVVGGVFTGLAVADRDEVAHLSNQTGTPDVLSEHARLTARGQEREAAAWVLYGVGAAAVVTGAVLLALDVGEDEDAGRVDIGLTPGGAAVGYTSRF